MSSESDTGVSLLESRERQRAACGDLVLMETAFFTPESRGRD